MNERLDLILDPARLRALRGLRALDTPQDEGLDALTNLARETLRAPVSLVTLVDQDRQFFKSCPGLGSPWEETRESPLSHSFCKHTLGVDDHLPIDDARVHPLVKDSPAIEEMGIIAYLGAPLITRNGDRVGAFCVMDRQPRQWAPEEALTLRRLADAAIRHLESSARIRELEDARQSVSKQESYFRSLVEQGMVPLTVLNAQGLVMYSSPGSREILGIAPEADGRQSVLENIHPEDRDAVRMELERVATEPNRTSHIHFRHRQPNGHWVHLEGVGRNLLHLPEVHGLVFSLRDVTGSTGVEQELIHRRKIETIGELTAGIAHDFNNLLAVVLSNAELLRKPLAEGEGEAFQDLEDLQAAARGGAELVRALMTFAHQGEPSIRPTDLGRVVEQTARMLRRILPSPISVEGEVASSLPPALADPRSVEQLLLNLATNARDAMPGGGTFAIRLRSDEATPEDPIPSGRALVLEVSDTGRGMTESTAAQAFEPFFTTKPAGRGTGLGLAMVARVVEAHGGAVRIDSEVGVGTRVTIRLPTAPKPTLGEALSSLSMHRALPGETVLVVEDQEALRRTARRVLERAGYEVLEAMDGPTGLEIFRAHQDQVSLVLSDHDMPGHSGMKLLREIRAMGSKVPFLLTTGATHQEVMQEPDFAEVVIVVPKPWMIEDLTRAIRRALDEAAG